jgi:hypothetical protein
MTEYLKTAGIVATKFFGFRLPATYSKAVGAKTAAIIF